MYGLFVCKKYETLSIRVLAAKTNRTNEYVCQDIKTQTGMQIWGVGQGMYASV